MMHDSLQSSRTAGGSLLATDGTDAFACSLLLCVFSVSMQGEGLGTGLLYSSSIPIPCDSSFLCPAGIDEVRQRNGRSGIACSIGNPPVSVECA